MAGLAGERRTLLQIAFMWSNFMRVHVAARTALIAKMIVAGDCVRALGDQAGNHRWLLD